MRRSLLRSAPAPRTRRPTEVAPPNGRRPRAAGFPSPRSRGDRPIAPVLDRRTRKRDRRRCPTTREPRPIRSPRLSSSLASPSTKRRALGRSQGDWTSGHGLFGAVSVVRSHEDDRPAGSSIAGSRAAIVADVAGSWSPDGSGSPRLSSSPSLRARGAARSADHSECRRPATASFGAVPFVRAPRTDRSARFSIAGFPTATLGGVERHESPDRSSAPAFRVPLPLRARRPSAIGRSRQGSRAARASSEEARSAISHGSRPSVSSALLEPVIRSCPNAGPRRSRPVTGRPGLPWSARRYANAPVLPVCAPGWGSHARRPSSLDQRRDPRASDELL